MNWLNLVLGVISLARWLTQTLHDNKTFAAGQTKAVADALKAASDEVALILKVREVVAEQHRKDPEGSIDKRFQRD